MTSPVHYYPTDPAMACVGDHGSTLRVTLELHAAILLRDRACVLSKIEPEHLCRDAWGRPHAAGDLAKLTIEHVHDGYGQMGRRAPSDLGHCLALCAAANVGVPSKSQRVAFRAYLRAVVGVVG